MEPDVTPEGGAEISGVAHGSIEYPEGYVPEAEED